MFVGISTGGVAEVFETNCPSGDEVILLKERRGLIKLAFRTGAELVPWCVRLLACMFVFHFIFSIYT